MSDSTRRGWGLGLLLGAAALGTGAWLRSRRPPLDTDTAAAALSAAPSSAGSVASAASTSASASSSPIPVALTLMDGRILTAADIAGRAVVLNFWAPWCPPCVREMPELDRFSRSAAGRKTLVIGLAIDERPNVDRFLAAHPVGFPVSVLGYGGLTWVRRLSNNGNPALPFSAVFSPYGKLVQRKFGPTDLAELTRWARDF